LSDVDWNDLPQELIINMKLGFVAFEADPDFHAKIYCSAYF
jgi:hypothetical protein